MKYLVEFYKEPIGRTAKHCYFETLKEARRFAEIKLAGGCFGNIYEAEDDGQIKVIESFCE